jgi:AraC family transcriptional regulator
VISGSPAFPGRKKVLMRAGSSDNGANLLDGITITETVYDREFVDWHYHENPHFTLVTSGKIKQGTRRETFECCADTLLFHNWQEPHYNIKPAGVTRAFQVEIDAAWYRKFEVDPHLLPAAAKITRPNIRLLFYNIYKEAKIFDATSTFTIDSLLLETFETIRGFETRCVGTPLWVTRLDELLHDDSDRPFSLRDLSNELGLHWAHLSREFPRYFRCNFSQYVRKLKVERSLALLRDGRRSVAEITFICGFADQSHFIRCFREFTGITPRNFRQISK